MHCQRLTLNTLTAILALAISGTPAFAGVSAEEAAKLGMELTPLGAERAGNADGSIPAWTGEGIGEVPAGYQEGMHHPNPYADEAPLATITAANVEQYTHQLTEGQTALFATYPETFKMKVFPSHRTAQFPDWYVKNTAECAATAELEDGGNGVTNAHACVPFPIPQSGIEVLWNHLLRFQGVYRIDRVTQPSPDAKGRYVLDKLIRHQYFAYYDPEQADSDVYSYFIPLTLAPARNAGDAFLLIDYKNPVTNPRKAWRYFGGQRRVRRAPVLVYDTPIPTAYGLRLVDSFDMFFGSPDKFEWTLQGKEEILVPYNNFELGSGDISFKEILTPGHINPEFTRYEKHRVWVVEGKLKDGERHVYSRRKIYLDEDTWTILVHDMYDRQGELWRSAMNYIKLYWEVPVMLSSTEVHHDLLSRRYSTSGLVNEYDGPIDLSKPIPDLSFFTPQSLRRLGVR